MQTSGPAKKLSIYIDETDKIHGRPVYELLLDIFLRKKMAGASVFRGVAGYGSHGKLHTAKLLELSTTLPLKIEVIDSENAINNLLPEITSLLQKGLIEVSDSNIILCGKRD